MNIVLIGLGMVAGTHLAAIDASPHRLHAVMARSHEKARAFLGDRSDVRIYATVEEIAEDDDVDFVILATPPNARRQIVEALVEAGKPILAEKPIERTFAAAHSIVALCEEKPVPFAVTFQHRAREASIALKRAIDDGVLGEISSLEMRVPWWRDQAYYDAPGRGSYDRDGGGVMINQAIHTLDLGLWLCGPVARVNAVMHKTPLHEMEAEDWAGAFLTLENGAMGSLTATTAAFPGGTETIFVQGTKAAASLAAGVLTLHHLDGRTETFGETATTGGGAHPMAFTHAWHQTIIEDFATCLTSGKTPIATGRSALMAQAVITAMEQSARTGQSVEVPAL